MKYTEHAGKMRNSSLETWNESSASDINAWIVKFMSQ
jgi:hypothetical protein